MRSRLLPITVVVVLAGLALLWFLSQFERGLREQLDPPSLAPTNWNSRPRYSCGVVSSKCSGRPCSMFACPPPARTG